MIGHVLWKHLAGGRFIVLVGCQSRSPSGELFRIEVEGAKIALIYCPDLDRHLVLSLLAWAALSLLLAIWGDRR
jgi:hypothetical protein